MSERQQPNHQTQRTGPGEERAVNTTADALRTVLDGRWAHIKDRARRELPAELLLPPTGLDRESHRARVADQMRLLAETGHARAGFREEFGGTNDIGASVTAFEMLALGDLSLLVKSGVQLGLFGGSVYFLGTSGTARS